MTATELPPAPPLADNRGWEDHWRRLHLLWATQPIPEIRDNPPPPEEDCLPSHIVPIADIVDTVVAQIVARREGGGE